MFSQACVKNSVGGGVLSVPVYAGIHPPDRHHPWADTPPRQPLQQVVCILLEYIHSCYRLQGNIFTPVCHSVHRGDLPQCMLGYHPQTRHPPAQSMPGDTVNALAVRILLESNLVNFATRQICFQVTCPTRKNKLKF